VVLIRWWTEGCPFCVAMAPALREFDRKYRAAACELLEFSSKPPGD